MMERITTSVISKLQEFHQNRPFSFALAIALLGALLIVISCMLPFASAGWGGATANLFGINWKQANALFLCATMQIYLLYHWQTKISIALAVFIYYFAGRFITELADSMGSIISPVFSLIGAKTLIAGIILNIVGMVAYVLLIVLSQKKLPVKPSLEFQTLLSKIKSHIHKVKREDTNFQIKYIGTLIVIVSLFLPFEMLANAFGISPLVAILAFLAGLWTLRAINQQGKDIYIAVTFLILTIFKWVFADRGVYEMFGFPRKYGFYTYIIGLITVAYGLIMSQRLSQSIPVQGKAQNTSTIDQESID